MDRPHQVFDCGFELQRRHGFRDELRRLRTDDVNTENLSVSAVGNDLDETFVLSDDGCARVGGKGELTYLDVVALLASLCFGQPHAANLGMAVGDVGNSKNIDGLILLARDL